MNNLEDSKLNKRSLQALETKKRIYESAMELFSDPKRSFDDITIDEITSLANVSKGSFYTYYESKEMVLVEHFEQIDEYYKFVLGKLPENASASQGILTMIYGMTEYCQNISGIQIIKIVYSSQISGSKSVRILNNRDRALYKHMDELISKGLESKEFTTLLDKNCIVEYLTRSARGLIYDWCLYDGDFNLIDEGQKYFSLILDNL